MTEATRDEQVDGIPDIDVELERLDRLRSLATELSSGTGDVSGARMMTDEEQEAWAARYNAALHQLLQDHHNTSLGPDGEYGYIHWQVGPHAAGRNGLEVNEALEVLIARVQFLNAVSFCAENEEIIRHLVEALGWVGRRRTLRERQQVRGTNRSHHSDATVRWIDEYGFVAPTGQGLTAGEVPKAAEGADADLPPRNAEVLLDD